MASTINKLLSEVLIMVSSNLPPQDILSIRKTCRPLQAPAEGPFFRHWVDTRHLIIDKESLRKFERISESPNPNFASSIRKLEIHTFYLPPIEDLSQALEEFAADYLAISEMEDLESDTDASHTSGSSSQCNDENCLDDECYRKHWEQQQRMMKNNQLVKALSKGVKSLTKCRKISFNQNDIPWSHTQQAEGFDGLSAMSSPTWEESSSFVRRIIQSVFAAAYESKLQLQDVDIHFGRFMDDAHCIVPSQPPRLENSVSGLRHLYLDIDPLCEGTSQFGHFISCFQDLSELDLEMCSNTCERNPTGILLDITIPELEKLSLWTMSCTAVELERFFRAHSETLRDINLIWVELGNTQHWRRIVETVKHRMPSVKLKMHYCVEREIWEANSAQGLVEIIHELDKRNMS